MTLVLIDLRSVCVFALRNNMLNGKMCLAPAGWGAPWCYHGGAKNTPDADSACRKRRLKEQKVWGSRNEPRELKSDMLGEKRSLTDHSMTQNHKYDFTD